MKKIFVLMALSVLSIYAAIFDNPSITLSVSPQLKQRIDTKDSLLPTFSPEENLRTLLRSKPQIWSYDDLNKNDTLATKLKIDFEFIDGTKDEEQYCKLLTVKKDSNEIPLEWSLRIGVDFISGGSSVVGDHIRLCLEQTRELMGIAVKRADSIVFVAPKKLVDDLDKHRVNANLSTTSRIKVFRISEKVARDGKCPTDVRSYAILLDIWKQVKDSAHVDLMQLNQDLNQTQNGSRKITSCSFNRDWNKHYSHEVDLSCNPDQDVCEMWKIPGGKQVWKTSNETEYFQYQGFSFLGLKFGKQTIHKGGDALDLRLIPLSENLYLETYVDLNGFPVALGLMTIAGKLK